MDALARLRALELPFAELIGIEFIEAMPERVVDRMTARAELIYDHELPITQAEGAPEMFGRIGAMMRGYEADGRLLWVAVVEWLALLAKVAVPGPLFWLQVLLKAPGGLDSVTEPPRVTGKG